MDLTINGKDYELKFGLKFIRQLDKVYKVDYQGLEFGMGVNLAFMNLNQYNPTALVEVINAALSHHSSTPKFNKIEEKIEDYAEENDGLGKLFEELLEELGKSAVVKDTLKQFKAMAQE